jgi:hypothetical protein
MRNHIVLLSLIATVSCGCEKYGLEPTEQVIGTSSDRDFGFVGYWREIRETRDTSPPFEIAIQKNTTDANYVISGVDLTFDVMTVTFTAIEVAPEKKHAIVEIQLADSAGNTMRRLVYATVHNEELRVWSINVVPLGDMLYDASIPAVIEHFFLSSKVRCNPDALLKILRKNPKQLLGEMRRFEMVEAKGK